MPCSLKIINPTVLHIHEIHSMAYTLEVRDVTSNRTSCCDQRVKPKGNSWLILFVFLTYKSGTRKINIKRMKERSGSLYANIIFLPSYMICLCKCTKFRKIISKIYTK